MESLPQQQMGPVSLRVQPAAIQTLYRDAPQRLLLEIKTSVWSVAMKRAFGLLVCVVMLLLAGCSTGPVKRIFPPSASIQELAVQADGSWQIVLRVQNFSTVPMTFAKVKATLMVDGVDVGEIDVSPNVDIVGESADVIRGSLRSSATLADGKGIAYALKGKIEVSAPNSKSFDFDHSSRLSPVPGIANTWR